MPRFDLDAQRGLVCLFGLVALAVEGIGFYVTGKTLPDIFTGAFITMATGPVLTTTAEKYREGKERRRRDDSTEESPSTSVSPSPPSSPAAGLPQSEEDE